MGTVFVPRNKDIEERLCNISGAELLRAVIGNLDDGGANISGVGYAEYVNAETARLYADRIKKHLSCETDMESGLKEFLNLFADFFKESKGFWQR